MAIKDEQADLINQPPHYQSVTDMPVQCIEAIEAAGLLRGFCLGNAIKYVWRDITNGDEPVLDDLKKGRYYLNYYIERCEGEFPNGELARTEVE